MKEDAVTNPSTGLTHEPSRLIIEGELEILNVPRPGFIKALLWRGLGWRYEPSCLYSTIRY